MATCCVRPVGLSLAKGVGNDSGGGGGGGGRSPVIGTVSHNFSLQVGKRDGFK